MGSPAYFKNCIPDGYKIIYNGIVYVFNIANKFERTDILLPEHYNGASQVNVISVLSTLDALEIGLSVGKVFKSFIISGCSHVDLIMKLSAYGGYITTLLRSDICNGIRFEQNLFVYASDKNIVDVVNVVKSLLKFKLEEC